MEWLSQVFGAVADICFSVALLVQVHVNRITSEQVEDLQQQIDELRGCSV